MVQLRIKVETKGVQRWLHKLHKRQLPFAYSVALNDTIFSVRKYIVGPTWRRAFDVRNKRFASAAFRVEKATKRKLESSLFDRLARASLDLHADGGTKRAKGSNLAIPSSNIKRTASGKISRAKQPRNLKNSFVANIRGQGSAVWQRYGKNGSKIRLMFDLERSARIKKRFRFYEDAEKITIKRFPKYFEKAFNRAVRTAR